MVYGIGRHGAEVTLGYSGSEPSGSLHRTGETVMQIIYNPANGTPVLITAEASRAVAIIADMERQGAHVAPLAHERKDRSWDSAHRAQQVSDRHYEPRHRRPCEVTRPHPTQPTIPGVR